MAAKKSHKDELKLDPKKAHRELTELLESIITLGGMLRVNEEGMIYYADGKQMFFKNDKTGDIRPIVLYRTDCKIKNAIMVNPTSESVGMEDPQDKKWFYNTVNTIHTATFSRLVEAIITNLVKALDGDCDINPMLVHVLSGLVNSMDKKTVEEYKKLLKAMPDIDGIDDEMISETNLITMNSKPRDFLSISRSRDKKTTILKAFCADDANRNYKNKVRKKTWNLIEKIFREIYIKDDLTQPLIEKPWTNAYCPMFVSFVEVLVESWNKMAPYLGFLYSDEDAEAIINKLALIEFGMRHINEYAKISRWAPGGASGTVVDSDGNPDKIMYEGNSVEANDTPKRGRPPKNRIDKVIAEENKNEDDIDYGHPEDDVSSEELNAKIEARMAKAKEKRAKKKEDAILDVTPAKPRFSNKSALEVMDEVGYQKGFYTKDDIMQNRRDFAIAKERTAMHEERMEARRKILEDRRMEAEERRRMREEHNGLGYRGNYYYYDRPRDRYDRYDDYGRRDRYDSRPAPAYSTPPSTKGKFSNIDPCTLMEEQIERNGLSFSGFDDGRPRGIMPIYDTTPRYDRFERRRPSEPLF